MLCKSESINIDWTTRRMGGVSLACLGEDVDGMGFRDLHCFNLAMLAKQGWHLMMEPNTLFAKIFKAKYFCKKEFFGGISWLVS